MSACCAVTVRSTSILADVTQAALDYYRPLTASELSAVGRWYARALDREGAYELTHSLSDFIAVCASRAEG